MKRISVTLLSVIALVMALFGVAAPAAFAAEGDSGSEITESSATSSSKTAAKAHSVNGVSIASDVTVLAYIQAKGATKKQMQAKKIHLPKAMTLTTSYRNTAGQEVWHKKSYPKGKLLVWGKDGWWHDPECWNKVEYRTPKPVPEDRIVKGKVKIVKKFVFKATSVSAVDGNAKATAKAWCRTGGSYSEAFGHGEATFAARAYASGRGRTWARAKANAVSSSAEKLSLEGHTETNVKIKVETDARGKATSDAYAEARCSYTPPEEEQPPPPEEEQPPPVVYDKPLAEIWAGEHAVDEYGTTTVWGRVKCDTRLTCLLARPTDNSDLGEMVSWMQGNVEDGWLRFSGTWRNANTLPPGEHTVTLTAVGTDSQGQQVTTTTTLKVVKVVHPET